MAEVIETEHSLVTYQMVLNLMHLVLEMSWMETMEAYSLEKGFLEVELIQVALVKLLEMPEDLVDLSVGLVDSLNEDYPLTLDCLDGD